MSSFDQEDLADAPTFEALKKMSKAEIQALVSSSRAALESVVSMPDAVRSEKYNAIASERFTAAENACRETERILDAMPRLPEVDAEGLAEAAAEAARILGGDLLAQDDETWRETLTRLRQIGSRMVAAEKSIAIRRTESVKLGDAFRDARYVDDDIRTRSESAMRDMVSEAGADWRLTSKVRSKPAVDPDFYNEYRQAQVSFAKETPLDERNSEKRASLKATVETLSARIEALQRQGNPGNAQEALRQIAIAQGPLDKIMMTYWRPADGYESEVERIGLAGIEKKMEGFGKERDAAATRRSELESAFLGKLRHRSEIDDLTRTINGLEEKLSSYKRATEVFGQEERRKRRASEASAALRGVDLG